MTWYQLPVNAKTRTYILRGQFRTAVEWFRYAMPPESIAQAWRSAMSPESRSAAERCYAALARSLRWTE